MHVERNTLQRSINHFKEQASKEMVPLQPHKDIANTKRPTQVAMHELFVVEELRREHVWTNNGNVFLGGVLYTGPI